MYSVDMIDTINENENRRGSEWRKWDLHVHSPKTFLANEYGTCSIEDFVKEVKDKGLTAIGLTNYFRFADEDLTEIKEKLENEGIRVFPNLEFRTQPPNKDKEEINVHVIFSDKISKGKIEDFLGRLKTIDDKYCKNLTPAEIKETSISFDTLKKALDEDKDIQHLEDYIFVACPRGYGSFRPSREDEGRGNNLAMTIDSKTDALFGKNGDTDFFLKASRYEGAVQKPVFLCSDSHEKSKIGVDFTWAKADVTFEGLKQTLYEPEERVKIQERNPDDSKPDRVVIDYITYTRVSGDECKIFFNKSLNSIIGVRGAGKSTLLKNIANSIDKKQFAENDGKAPYPLNKFNVSWRDGNTNSGTEESPKSIFYIPQNYLSSLAYDDGTNTSKRDDFLTSLLKKNARFSNAIQSFESFVAKNKIKIEECVQKLLFADNTEKETEAALKKQGAETEINNEIKKKNEQIKEYQKIASTEITNEEVVSYSDGQKLVSDYKKTINILSQDKEILSALSKDGANIFISSKEFNLLSLGLQETIRKEINKQSENTLKTLVAEEIAKINKQIEELNKKLSSQEELVKGLEEKVKKSKALDDLTKELSQLKSVQEKVIELKERRKKALEEKAETIDILVGAYNDFESHQALIYNTISFDEKFSFLKVEIVAKYNIPQLKSFVEKNINTRDTESVIKSDEVIKNLFSDSPEKPSGEAIKLIVNGLIDGKIKIKVDANDVAGVISQLLKNRFEIDYLNSVKTQGGETCFKDMTGGQKAIALLELIFRFDDEKYPILIDQPEDDLDVGGVATDLVNFIKAEKKERQIIAVTHNASLVVCSDSEEILVSNIERASGGKYDFSYLTGAIENQKRRDDIIRILEGGNDALRKRMLKLNVK